MEQISEFLQEMKACVIENQNTNGCGKKTGGELKLDNLKIEWGHKFDSNYEGRLLNFINVWVITEEDSKRWCKEVAFMKTKIPPSQIDALIKSVEKYIDKISQ